MMLAAVYAAWCALCWRLRGGLISNVTRLFGYTMSTGETRVTCALLMVLPLAGLGWWTLAVFPFLFAATTLPYFDRSMGLEEKADYGWLAMWGAAVTSLALLPAIYMSPDKAWLVCGGPLLMLPYALAKPLGGNWTERAECGVGFLLGLLMWMAYHG